VDVVEVAAVVTNSVDSVDVVVVLISAESAPVLVVEVVVVVDWENAAGISSETSQYPLHSKLEAPSTSISMSSQLVALTHDMEQGPSPHSNTTLPLHESFPSQNRVTEEASDPSISVMPAHALLPMQLI